MESDGERRGGNGSDEGVSLGEVNGGAVDGDEMVKVDSKVEVCLHQ